MWEFLSHELKRALCAFQTSFQPSRKMYATFTQLWVTGVGGQLLYQPRYFYQLVSHGISMAVSGVNAINNTKTTFLVRCSIWEIRAISSIYIITLDALHLRPSVTRVNWNSCWGTRHDKATFKSVSRRNIEKDKAKMKTAGKNLRIAWLARSQDNLQGDWM